MLMLIQETPPLVQAVRRVYENEDATVVTATSTTFHIACHPDVCLGKDIILWDDIVAAFKDVVHVRSGTMILPFLKGPDFKNLDPLRIAAVPGVTLDVVIKGQSVRAESSSTQGRLRSSLSNDYKALPDRPQKALPSTSQENAAGTQHREQLTLDQQQDANFNLPPPPSYSDINVQQPISHPYTAYHAHDTTEPMYSARLGDKDAQAALADKYHGGHGITQDFSKAFEWYLKAADQGHVRAQSMVGDLYRSGQGVDVDYSQAMLWCLKAAQQGNSDAQNGIGILYLYGLGTPRDYSQALDWLLRSAAQGHPRAQCSIGYMYDVGHGVPLDHSQAMLWYLKAANQGNGPAQYNIGAAYESGRGVPKDISMAMVWYKMAADSGDTDAKDRIDVLERSGHKVHEEKKRGLLKKLFH
ncbi:hypothetical protein BGW39_000860 [Mortierella sp. 14UC]|nr:hypothetical protein BGW39_000860 [Mortierella sp. 14UC]